MILNEIKITDSVSIFVTNIEYNKELLLKEIKLNIDVNARTERESGEEKPGLQSTIIISGKEIDRIYDYSLELLETEFNYNIDKPHIHHKWIYVSDNTNNYGFYHKHNMIVETNIRNAKWTHTFYAQMPDNLHGDDGYLFFQTDDGIEYKFLPKEGDLIFFPASLFHMPQINKNSSKDRIVLGGIFKSLNFNDKIIKEEKSLL